MGVWLDYTCSRYRGYYDGTGTQTNFRGHLSVFVLLGSDKLRYVPIGCPLMLGFEENMKLNDNLFIIEVNL